MVWRKIWNTKKILMVKTSLKSDKKLKERFHPSNLIKKTKKFPKKGIYRNKTNQKLITSYKINTKGPYE